MGYDLHITRRKHWASRGKDITAAEWLDYVKRDPEFGFEPDKGPCFAVWKGSTNGEWLDWEAGQIYSKNPSPAFTEKMVSIARQLGAVVQGDDGEIYESGTRMPHKPKRALWDLVASWFTRLHRVRRAKIEHEPPDFNVEDKVYDVCGNEHIVISIEPEAVHGIGVIRTRRCSDGTEMCHFMIAHGLSRAHTCPRSKQSS